MALKDDIKMLREIQRDLDGDPELGHNQVGRVIAILEPLAGLSDEQVAMALGEVSLRASNVGWVANETDDPQRAARLHGCASALRALVASLTALRGMR